MPQTHRLDYIQGGVSGPGRFVVSYPTWLDGRVSRQQFTQDVESINAKIASSTAITRFYSVGFGVSMVGMLVTMIGFFTGFGSFGIPPSTIVGFVVFFLGIVLTFVWRKAHEGKLEALFSREIPAALNEMAPRYGGVSFNIEQDTQVAYGGGYGYGHGHDLHHRRHHSAYVHRSYKLVLTDAEVAGQVVGVTPLPASVVTGVATAPTTRYCTNCGAAVAPSARFCASCGHAQ
mmetsp:Transcript_10593/g.31591  ORF Transcript_10593/g.31591 Transcript_10593/m.31591 type:complete len:232 (+) Transcript_10593:163-858(+)